MLSARVEETLSVCVCVWGGGGSMDSKEMGGLIYFCFGWHLHVLKTEKEMLGASRIDNELELLRGQVSVRKRRLCRGGNSEVK